MKDETKSRPKDPPPHSWIFGYLGRAIVARVPHLFFFWKVARYQIWDEIRPWRLASVGAEGDTQDLVEWKESLGGVFQ